MTTFLYDRFGYIKGIEFPVEIPGYGKIYTQADWEAYVNMLAYVNVMGDHVNPKGKTRTGEK